MIGDIEIDCYVLEDEIRVLSQRGFLGALGRSPTPPSHAGRGVDNPPYFLQSKRLEPFISLELLASTTPIPFQIAGGNIAYGFRAETLPQVCEVYLKAQDAGDLLPSQKHIAERAGILVRGLATIGIIGLVDEATGYQKIRARRALADILEKFIAKDLREWTLTFPYEFYEEIFRLNKWPGPDGVKRPQIIGKYTNEIVYRRLAPGVLERLKAKNPVEDSGYRPHRHHQWLSADVGYVKLKEHLAAVTALMRASANWSQFMRLLERAFPIYAYQSTFLDDD